VDDIVLFRPLTLEESEQIVDLQIEDLRRRLADRQVRLDLAPEAREFIARAGYDPVYGARPLKRYLQRQLETRIGRAVIAGEVPDGARITLSVRDGALAIETAAGTAGRQEKS